MEKATSQFSLYDHLAYVFVGGIAMIVGALNAKYFFGIVLPDLNLGDAAVALVVAYFLGHIIQAVANTLCEVRCLKFLMNEDKKDFSEVEKDVLARIRKHLSVDTDDSATFRICTLFATGEDKTGQVQSTNAYYSLYRGWYLLFVLESIFLLFALIRNFSVIVLLLVLLSFLSALLLRNRSRRFWKYFRQKVLDTCVIAVERTK